MDATTESKNFYDITKKYLKDVRVYLTLVVLVSFLWRFLNLSYYSFWIDEATTAFVSNLILTKFLPILNSGIFYSSGTLNLYLIALFFKLFGQSEFSARLVSVLFGSFSVLLLFYFVKQITRDGRIALITSLFMAFSTLEIIWSRQARMYSQLQFFYFLSLLFFYRYIENIGSKKTNLVVLICAVIFSLLTHILSNVLFAIFLLYAVLTHKLSIAKMVENKPKLIARGFVLLCLASLFLWYYDLNKVLLLANTIRWGQVWEYLVYANNTFSLILYLSIIGLFLLFKESKKNFAYFALAVLLPFVLISLFIPVVYDRYIYFFLVPMLFIFAAFSIVKLSDRMISKNKNITTVAIISITLTILIVGSNFDIFNLNPKSPTDYKLQRIVPQTNYRIAYSYMDTKLSDDDLIVSVSQGLTPAAFYLGEKFDSTKNFAFDNTTNPYLSSFLSWSVVYDGNNYDIYTNSSIITNFDSFDKLINKKDARIWIVLDRSKSSHLDTGFKEFLEKKALLINEASDSSVSTYLYSKENLDYLIELDNLKSLDENFELDNVGFSKKIVENETVLYPLVADQEASAVYHLALNSTISEAFLEVSGRKRDALHSLDVSISKTGENYTKVIVFESEEDEKIVKRITNETSGAKEIWIKFGFFKNSLGKNYPRIHSFRLVVSGDKDG